MTLTILICSIHFGSSGVLRIKSFASWWAPMAPTGRKIPVRRPATLLRGYYFRMCRAYTTTEGVTYDYKLYNDRHQLLKCQARGPRKLLSFNFSKRHGRPQRLDIHRVFAMSSERCNARQRNWSAGVHVHHCAHPRSKPWSNCRESNMIVLCQSDHEEWHRRHPGSPHSLQHR